MAGREQVQKKRDLSISHTWLYDLVPCIVYFRYVQGSRTGQKSGAWLAKIRQEVL